jgi:hypothetical protein
MLNQILTMKKLAFLLGLFVILLVPSAMAYEQNLYYYNGFTSSSFFQVYGDANLSLQQGNCTTNVLAFAEFNTAGSYQYRFNLYINDSLVWQNNYIGAGSQICPNIIFLGNKTINSGFARANLTAQAIASPVPTTAWLVITSNCFANDTNVYITSENESYGYNMYLATALNYTVSSEWNSSIPNLCFRHDKRNPVNATADYPSYALMYFVPFNTKSGNVTLHWGGVYTMSNANILIGYFDVETGTEITTRTFSAGLPPVTYDIDTEVKLTLQQNNDYVMFFAGISTDPFVSFSGHPPIMNVTVLDYTSNFVCGNWSSCSGGYQTRTCTDTKGVYPPQIQTRTCLLVNQTIVMGFEDFMQDTDTVKECNKYWYLLGCGWFVENRTIWQPVNPAWRITASELAGLYVATVTQSDTEKISAPLGSRFLKMWYMPPYWAEHPTLVNGTWQCYNFSGGTPSWVVYENINSSFFVSYNFTFPSPSMLIYFDVRRCPSQVVQYDTGLWCGKACYGNCAAQPKGNYWVGLHDLTTDEWVLRYDGISIAENWTRISLDVTNKIQVGHQYRLFLSVEPPNSWWGDPDGYCSYFDRVLLYNAQYSTKDEQALNLFGKLYNELTDEQKHIIDEAYCSKPYECKGNDKYVYTLQNDVCVAQIYYNDSICVAQQQQKQIANQSIFLPISSVANTMVTANQTLEQNLKASGYGFLLIFLTPIFWIMILVISVMMVAAYYTKHMEIGGISGLLLLIAMAAYFTELIWIAIVVIIIAGFIIGRTVVKAVTGGG